MPNFGKIGANLSKGVARTKQIAMEKMGKAEGTVDIQMEAEKDTFAKAYEDINTLNKETHELMVSMKKLSVAQTNVANAMHALFPTDAEFYNSVLKLQDSTRFVDNAREDFEKQMHEDMLEPISLYLGQYREMKHRIEIYDTRRVDKDRYARDLRKAQEKGKYGELQHLEDKVRVSKENYAALNEELMKDLPAMTKDRLKFFPLAVATYVHAFNEYFRSGAKSLAESRSMTDHLNRNDIQGYLHVITPLEESSVRNFATLAGMVQAGDTGAADTPAATAPAAAAVAASPAPKKATPPAPVPKKAAAPPPKPKGKPTATALYDFEAQEDNELPFKKGDKLTLISQDGDWWDAELNGAEGMVPANYLKMD